MLEALHVAGGEVGRLVEGDAAVVARGEDAVEDDELYAVALDSLGVPHVIAASVRKNGRTSAR
jgi:hypothetical protein